MLVVYSVKEGEVALDGEGGHSPFARALLGELPERNIEGLCGHFYINTR